MTNNIGKLVSEFKQIQVEFNKVLEMFPINKVNEKLFGEWNIKDVIAHFIGWDREFTETLLSLKNGTNHTYWGKIYEFNEKTVTASKSKSWNELLNEFRESGSEFIESYVDYPTNLLNTKIWKDKIYTPVRILEINIHHYQKAQFVRINELLERWRQDS
jgi:hypothetical protein